MTGLDHVSFSVSDLKKSRVFYEAALRPLGLAVLRDFGEAIGMGDTVPFLWIAGGPPGHSHLAFSASSHAEVDAFYAAAMAAGGADNGGPNFRPEYHENYYAAFVLDPDGHNIEAVCHAAE